MAKRANDRILPKNSLQENSLLLPEPPPIRCPALSLATEELRFPGSCLVIHF